MSIRRLFCACTALFLTLCLGAPAKAATFTVGWDVVESEPEPGGAPTGYNYFASDSKDNIYQLSLLQTSHADFWAVYKYDGYGNLQWDKLFEFALHSSTPTALLVDGASDVYAIGTLTVSNNLSEGLVEKLSPTGSSLFTKTIPSSIMPGISILAGTTDSANNLYLGLRSPVQGGSTELEVNEYSPTFVPIHSFVNDTLIPLSAAFDANHDIVASGIPVGKSGTVIDLITSAGIVQFTKLFQPQTMGSSYISPNPSFAIGKTPGHVVIWNNITTTTGSKSTNSFELWDFRPGGDADWTTPVRAGTVNQVSQASPTATFVDYTNANQDIETCVNGSGGFNFTLAPGGIISQLLGATINSAAVEEGWYFNLNKTTGTYILTIVNSSGHIVLQIDTKFSGTGFTPTSNGGVVNGFLAGATQDGVQLERVVEGPTLASVTGTDPIGGFNGTVTVTLSELASTPVTVNLAASAALKSSMTVPATVTVPAGSLSAKANVTSTPVSTPKAGVITGEAGGSKKNGNGGVQVANVSTVVLDNNTIVGGNLWGGTVTLDGKAGAQGDVVVMTSDHTNIIPNANFDVDAGATSVKVGDVSNKPTVDTVVKLTFSVKGGTGKPVTVEITVKAK